MTYDIDSQVHYFIEDASFPANVIQPDNGTWVFYSPCLLPTQCTHYDVELQPGLYYFEARGASGGNYILNNIVTTIGGEGGISGGQLLLKAPTRLYFKIGTQGNTYVDSSLKVSPGGFNGGGTSNAGSSGGGGATDIRLDADDLNARILVAGGGAGSNNSQRRVGAGGGLSGGDGSSGLGGTQTEGGFGYPPGAFGQGGSAIDHQYEGSGGGGGYYGGGKGSVEDGLHTGGGGSSFVSGFPGCDAVDESGLHTGQPDHYSGHVFSYPKMKQGGNAGDGCITLKVMHLPSKGITHQRHQVFLLLLITLFLV